MKAVSLSRTVRNLTRTTVNIPQHVAESIVLRNSVSPKTLKAYKNLN